jgi:hypothetical protein
MQGGAATLPIDYITGGDGMGLTNKDRSRVSRDLIRSLD